MSKAHPIGRRGFLGLAALGPLALASAGRAADVAACYDPASLSATQKNFRKSLGFVETAKDPKRACKGCAFYSATKDGCGTCQLLSRTPVPANGSCNSFAAGG